MAPQLKDSIAVLIEHVLVLYNGPNAGSFTFPFRVDDQIDRFLPVIRQHPASVEFVGVSPIAIAALTMNTAAQKEDPFRSTPQVVPRFEV